MIKDEDGVGIVEFERWNVLYCIGCCLWIVYGVVERSGWIDWMTEFFLKKYNEIEKIKEEDKRLRLKKRVNWLELTNLLI